jgi:hypothetical protein
MARGQDLDNYEQVSDDRYDSMNADCSLAGRPGKHEQAKDRHKLVGPDQSRNSENQIQLHNQIKD